ncbi:Lrp/AsnC family transcriptional regulator [Oricola thermophila]|uniref:Lrp/AsnC family transcriptional regulator n=1 Tax=Oricola thermophila TaxID=2742145 RepID=A0A6N1VEH0_9HYPH|nr:Lrp/AsnC family transcriptional regulator [Oricola thermophila]QKV19346.1 Lrp/AsnC family transcriptional regulator [Oricola thermophila]
MLRLDDRDIKILSILSREGRISKTDLARRINLSPTPCWDRLKRLEQAGVIQGYRAEISLKSIASHVVVFVVVELDNHRAETFQAFEKAVDAHDEIVACWALGGGFDYLMQVVARDIDSYQRLMDDMLERKAAVARYFTYIVTKDVKAGGLPLDRLLGTPE